MQGLEAAMNRTTQAYDHDRPNEMSIVDTFTKLIFGEESGYDEHELRIIEVLRVVDKNVSIDSHTEMGDYLRAMGVQEMIELVSAVRRAILNGTRGNITFPAKAGSAMTTHSTRNAH